MDRSEDHLQYFSGQRGRRPDRLAHHRRNPAVNNRPHRSEVLPRHQVFVNFCHYGVRGGVGGPTGVDLQEPETGSDRVRGAGDKPDTGQRQFTQDMCPRRVGFYNGNQLLPVPD